MGSLTVYNVKFNAGGQNHFGSVYSDGEGGQIGTVWKGIIVRGTALDNETVWHESFGPKQDAAFRGLRAEMDQLGAADMQESFPYPELVRNPENLPDTFNKDEVASKRKDLTTRVRLTNRRHRAKHGTKRLGAADQSPIPGPLPSVMPNESEMIDQLVGNLLEENDPEPEPQLRPFSEEDWMGYGGAERPEGSEPLIGDIDLGGIQGEVIVDRNGVGIHAFGPNEEQIFFYHPTPFAQGRGIAAQVIRARPDIDKLGEFGFNRVV